MTRNKFLLALLVIVAVFALSATAGMARDTQYLNMGSTSSTSGLYSWCVATASVMNKADIGVNVTVVESGAALDNLRRMHDGIFDFALCVDLPSAMQMYKGMDTFEGEQWKEVRWLFVRNIIADRVYVRKDSGVEYFSDLAGKRFSPGIPGSSGAGYMMKIDEVLGTEIDFLPAAYGDAINLLKQGRIVGLQKSSSINAIDSSLIEVNLTTPITAIGFKKENIEKVRETYPYLNFLETPKGKIKQLPEVGPIWEECPIVGAVATPRISQETGYHMIKTYVENFDKIADAYSGVKGWKPVEDYFKYAAPGGEIPAHAGLVQYAKEQGIDVPERFIPPEYEPQQ
ncbi:MAG: TAXI family TRAP transporter solute-binding subunit [Synergistales bacterium]|nr:TAXI family TRAP transporter solute-binding subunit [Synergistales bacterium]